MKYDCTKTLDYTHEMNRMCEAFSPDRACNDDCPLLDYDCITPTSDHIAIVQKWSDEHPEIPKLTKREFDFLKTFWITYGKAIWRNESRILYLKDERLEAFMAIDSTMFPFIGEGEKMTFDELLKLEVKDE